MASKLDKGQESNISLPKIINATENFIHTTKGLIEGMKASTCMVH